MTDPTGKAAHMALTMEERPSKPCVEALYKPYLAELSAYTRRQGDDAANHSLLPSPYFDRHWTEPSRDAFLFTTEGQHAGFALTRQSSAGIRELCEFFVLPEHRRQGIGRLAAHHVFARHPGRWQLAILSRNQTAKAFWARCLAQLDIEDLTLGQDAKGDPQYAFTMPARSAGR